MFTSDGQQAGTHLGPSKVSSLDDIWFR